MHAKTPRLRTRIHKERTSFLRSQDFGTEEKFPFTSDHFFSVPETQIPPDHLGDARLVQGQAF
jgi:hypothetical protein